MFSFVSFVPFVVKLLYSAPRLRVSLSPCLSYRRRKYGMQKALLQWRTFRSL
jgi:hypothetical protein